MLTERDFIQKFEKYSDAELYNMVSSIDDYSEEAQSAFKKVVDAKGGLERLNNSIEKQKIITDEVLRIEKEINNIGCQGFSEEFILANITSEILSEKQIQEIVDKQYAQIKKTIEDKKVDSQTIGQCIAAGIVSFTICGIGFGTFLVFTSAFNIYIIIGLALACYAIIKLIVRKSGHNNAVFLTTMISSVLALLLGYFLFQLIGPVL